MRLLLDESVPVRLRHHLRSHQVRTVGEMGWGGATNGQLLSLAAPGFDALITVDKGMQYQHNVQKLPLAVVILRARSNKLSSLLPLVAELEAALGALHAHSLVLVGR